MRVGAILPQLTLEAGRSLRRVFLPYQINWILNPARLMLAEKSVRIGWTFADAFRNVRKRLLHPRRDYLFATKDYPTALEYVRTCFRFCELFNVARDIICHGEEYRRLPQFSGGRASGIMQEVKVGVITFSNRSRILAFSSNPNALRAYGGDVGLDEFAFHPAARELWAAASGRTTWGFDLAVWSSHNGPDTLFLQLARDAACGKGGWSYYRVAMPDAIEMGLVDKINQSSGARFTPEEFLEDCKNRARYPEVFEQEYLCHPGGAASSLVTWDTVEHCLDDFQIERLHLEESQVLEQAGGFDARTLAERERRIQQLLHNAFDRLWAKTGGYRLGFDVAASGHGDLSAVYVDRVEGDRLCLAALFTCRTQDWHFLKTAVAVFLRGLPELVACGDETGLGRQICWELAQEFPGVFVPVNFSREKNRLGFSLMNQLALARRRLPRNHPDIAADFMAIQKRHLNGRWTFHEGRNPLNPASHCDIAWAAALAGRAHEEVPASGAVFLD